MFAQALCRAKRRTSSAVALLFLPTLCAACSCSSVLYHFSRFLQLFHAPLSFFELQRRTFCAPRAQSRLTTTHFFHARCAPREALRRSWPTYGPINSPRNATTKTKMRRIFALSAGDFPNAMRTLANADEQKRVLCFWCVSANFSRENFTKKPFLLFLRSPAGLGGDRDFFFDFGVQR